MEDIIINGQTYSGLTSIEVEKADGSGILELSKKPSGRLEITENGDGIDVTEVESVDVRVGGGTGDLVKVYEGDFVVPDDMSADKTITIQTTACKDYVGPYAAWLVVFESNIDEFETPTAPTVIKEIHLGISHNNYYSFMWNNYGISKQLTTSGSTNRATYSLGNIKLDAVSESKISIKVLKDSSGLATAKGSWHIKLYRMVGEFV